MVRENRRRWLPMAAMCGLVIIGTGRLYGQVSTGVGIHKHALGYTTALGSSEVGKIYVPSRYGGVLTLKGNAKLYYTNGADLTTDVATQIYSGALESALVAQGNYCVFTVPSGQWGWFYFVVPGGTSGISNTFVEAGQASYRPWNGWWWPFVPSSGPTLYDAGGPMQKYDTAYNGSIVIVTPPTPRTTFYSEKLDANPGWTTTGAWAFGTPTGAGGDHGGNDPTSGYTGTNVYGYNLTGGYTNNMTPQYLTTTAINCTNQADVHLKFRRWLCIESSQYDHASVQVSKDGTNWVTAWDFSGATLIETAWSLQEIDISATADNQPTVYIRWVMGPTDVGWTYGGWNIDDIELTAGTVQGTVFYQQNLDSNPGWTTTGAWAYGTPTGAGGDHGGNDPKAGYTGTSVYGYNLTGGYANNLTPQYLTTTALNCSGQTGVHLRFRRWLCVESSQYDHASVQVSKDGSTWTTAWDFSGPTLIETAWSLQDIDISSVADNQPAVYIRWVMGPTDVGWTYGGWNIDDIQLVSIPTPTVTTFYSQPLDTNPGWTTTGQWAYGTPTGAGGDHGGADPTSGYTGTSVYGYNLTGGYANNLTPQYLTTTALNCSGQTGVHLRFRRWLCVESSQYDHASVQVSKDGSTWTTAWDFSGPTLIETAWSLQDIDISSVADNQPAVYIRWAMGPTDVGWTYGGWNIDDIQLVSIPTPTVTTFYSQPLDTNPGWTTTGQWAYGTPTGAGGDHGGADPTSGYTGTSVYGYNLTGGYANNLTPQYLTTAALDCSGQTGVHLRFRRWLCVESSQYDHASVQVSKDGSTWTTAWDFSGPTLIETAWSLQDIDISSVADNQPTVYVRWVMGPTDVGWTYGGWNIDDIELTSGNQASTTQQQLPKTYAQSWEKSNEGAGQYWFGHCWGWSIAAILIPLPQATTKYGVSFTRDDMKGLYTELCDDQPYSDPSLSISFIPATSPTTALGQDVDAYCDELYRILRISIREDKVPVQSDMRAIATPPNNANEVWNQSIYKYSTNVREVPGAGNERLVEMDMNVYSNFGPWPPPTDYTNDRNEEFVYRLEFDAQGQVIANSPNQNWVSASHYPPHDLYRLTGSPYAAPNPYITKTLIDGLYQP